MDNYVKSSSEIIIESDKCVRSIFILNLSQQVIYLGNNILTKSLNLARASLKTRFDFYSESIAKKFKVLCQIILHGYLIPPFSQITTGVRNHA